MAPSMGHDDSMHNAGAVVGNEETLQHHGTDRRILGHVGLSRPPLAHAARSDAASFGTLADGTRVEKITLTDDNGVSVSIMTYGATMQEFIVPDRDGNVGRYRRSAMTTCRDYAEAPNYLGATIGRYANRIAGGTLRRSTARPIS